MTFSPPEEHGSPCSERYRSNPRVLRNGTSRSVSTGRRFVAAAPHLVPDLLDPVYAISLGGLGDLGGDQQVVWPQAKASISGQWTEQPASVAQVRNPWRRARGWRHCAADLDAVDVEGARPNLEDVRGIHQVHGPRPPVAGHRPGRHHAERQRVAHEPAMAFGHPADDWTCVLPDTQRLALVNARPGRSCTDPGTASPAERQRCRRPSRKWLTSTGSARPRPAAHPATFPSR